MKILLRSINPDGSAGGEKTLDVATLRIGRDAAQDIVLGDFRIALTHAEITPHKSLLGSGLRVEAKSRLGIYVNEAPVNSADLSNGDEINLGRFSIAVSKGVKGHDAVLTLKETYAAHDEREARKDKLRTSISDTGWSRRKLAWVLFFALLVPGLLLPAFFHMHPSAASTTKSATREYKPQLKAGMDVLWNPGSLSSAHHLLVNDCSVCHKAPFQQVRDESCKGCHSDLKEHAASHATLKEAPFSTQRCTDCHREHNGGKGLIPVVDAGCTSCHAKPEGMPGKKLLPVISWSKGHPEFLLRLARRDDTGTGFKWVEFRQGTPEAKMSETGLKYPHDIHLSAKGIDAPGGKKVLECAYCHQLAEDGVSYKPISMAPHCDECHRLDFDPLAPKRELPHGKPREVVQVVRDYYARIALAGGVTDRGAPAIVATRRVPGEVLPPAMARAALQWADGKADIALRDVFERRTCFYCHVIIKQPENTLEPWKIAPVAPVKSSMQASIFPHAKHSTETCESCHATKTSKKSEDVSLPDIKHCRSCHGDTGAMTETPSNCQSCHGYHVNNLQPLPKTHPALPAAAKTEAGKAMESHS